MPRRRKTGDVPASPLGDFEPWVLTYGEDLAEYDSASSFDVLLALAAWHAGAQPPSHKLLKVLAGDVYELLSQATSGNPLQNVVEEFVEKLDLKATDTKVAGTSDKSQLAIFAERAVNDARLGAVLAIMERDEIGQAKATAVAAVEYPQLGSDSAFKRSLADFRSVHGDPRDYFGRDVARDYIEAHWQRHPSHRHGHSE